MVNYGRSAGCITCRRRRIKCDEAKPRCRRCMKSGLQCGGYRELPKKLRYKDESHKFINIFPQRKSSKPTGKVSNQTDKDVVEKPSEAAETPPLSRRDQSALPTVTAVVDRTVRASFARTAYKSLATQMFLRDCVTLGRGVQSTRGFFEAIVPILRSEREDSPLATAVSAVSSTYFSLWTEGPAAFLSPHAELSHSLARLRAAIQDPAERIQPQTTLAALLLHWRENVVSVYSGQRVLQHHLQGAISLQPLQDDTTPRNALTNTPAKVDVTQFLLHVGNSLALRNQNIPWAKTLSRLRIRGGHEVQPSLPPNPSFELDDIGLEIVDLQASFSSLMADEEMLPLSAESPARMLSGPADWLRRAVHVHRRLMDWPQSLPQHWHPLTLFCGKDFPSSCTSYRDVCGIYSSCQVASIWNLWRYYRLRCAVMLLLFLNHQPDMAASGLGDAGLGPNAGFATMQANVQGIVDDICSTVPFYLGNRANPSSLHDFSDPAIVFPSQFVLPKSDPRFRIWGRHAKQDEGIASPEDHKRHAVAQGAWHVLGSLSRLLYLLSSSTGCFITQWLRPGQHDWIRKQFIRIAILLRLPPLHELDSCNSLSTVDTIVKNLYDSYSIIGGI